jgi:hypothetical protein
MLSLREMRDHLLLKLRPVAAGDHRNLGNPKQAGQQRGHLGVQCGFALGQRSVQIEHNQLLQGSLRFRIRS